MVWQDLKVSTILAEAAYPDAVTTVLALGGSTNAVIHLVAMAGRAGLSLGLDDFDVLARRVPVLANVRPGGEYLMEDFYYAGGLPGLLARLVDLGLLHTDRPTVTGRTLGENLAGALVHNDDVIRPATTRSPTRAGSPCCAATWRPTGP